MAEEKTPIAEVVEPLTSVEQSLVAAVGEWQEERRKQLEVEWQRVQVEANRRISPVLVAHGLTEGDTFEIRDDALSATGVVLAIRKGAALLARAAAPAVVPVGRAGRRQLQKAIGKQAGRRGGR